MKIFYRCCETQESITKEYDRWNNFPKELIIQKSWLSLQSSASKDDQFFVFYDNVSDYTRNFIENNCKGLLSTFYVGKHDFSDHKHNRVLVNIVSKELKNCNDTDWFYLVEDDYLHVPNALSVMRECQKYWGGWIVPYDRPINYIDPYYCQILVGQDRHWRSVDNATLTFSTRAITLRAHWAVLANRISQSDDTVFQKIFQSSTCIAPMPAIATHLTDIDFSPLIPWVKIWNEIENV